MSELYGTAYRDRAESQAISATKLLGQVMFLVAIALPVIAYFATVETSALTQAFAGTAATVAGAGALGFFLSLLNIFSGR